MFKKIIALGLLLVMAFSLGACRGRKYIANDFDTVEELQAACPQLYFFDFDVDEIDFIEISADGWKTGSVKDYVGYWISFSFKPQDDNFNVSINVQGHENLEAKLIGDGNGDFFEERIIDGIECQLYYEKINGSDLDSHRIYTVFVVDDSSRYCIIFYAQVEHDQFTEEMTTDYFVDYAVSIIEPAIESRHMGPKI